MAAKFMLAAALAVFSLTGCTTADVLLPETAMAPQARPSDEAKTPLDGLIAQYAAHYEVPESLVRRVVKRESNFRPGARNGPYWGLMQIRHDTAQTMGYRGPASGLLDAETNLKYAVKYLRGAYMVAGGNHDRSVALYARGYYYDAKRKGLLVATGLRPGPKKAEQERAVAKADPLPGTAPTSFSFVGNTPSGPAASAPMPAFRPQP